MIQNMYLPVVEHLLSAVNHLINESVRMSKDIHDGLWQRSPTSMLITVDLTPLSFAQTENKEKLLETAKRIIGLTKWSPDEDSPSAAIVAFIKGFMGAVDICPSGLTKTMLNPGRGLKNEKRPTVDGLYIP